MQQRKKSQEATLGTQDGIINLQQNILGLRWGEPEVAACMLSIYASGEHGSFLPTEHPLAAIFPHVLQSAEWCFGIEDLLVRKEDKV